MHYTEKFDHAHLAQEQLRVKTSELTKALEAIPVESRKAMEGAIECVRFYNEKTLPKEWRVMNPHGAIVGENFYPIERVGLYVPGGQVPLISTVIMTVTLAKIAGCKEIVVATPPQVNGEVDSALLAALQLSGVTEVYRVGGVQAIAALACGTESIRAVDKVFGPGNAYVIEAKRQLLL